MNRSIAYHLYLGNLDALKRDISEEKRRNRIKDGDLNKYVKMAIDDSRNNQIEIVDYLISEGADFMSAMDHAKNKEKIAIFKHLAYQSVNMMPV